MRAKHLDLELSEFADKTPPLGCGKQMRSLVVEWSLSLSVSIPPGFLAGNFKITKGTSWHVFRDMDSELRKDSVVAPAPSIPDAPVKAREVVLKTKACSFQTEPSILHMECRKQF